MNHHKKAIALFSVLLWGLAGFGQKNDYVWLSGYDSQAGYYEGVHFGISKMDFNYSPRSITYDSLGMNFDETNVSFCDSNGNLLFYCNGIYIANALDEKIENSDSLNAGWEQYDWDPTIQEDGYRNPQGILAIPVVSVPNQYYLIYSWNDSASPEGIVTKKILTALLDMSANSSLGNVVFKNQSIITNLLGSELSATRNGNGKDWWILAQQRNGDCYYRIAINDTGVYALEDLTCGGSSISDIDIGASCFSPDGSKYTYLTAYTGLNIFDFDRCSGELSNPIYLPLPIIADSSWLGLGVAISPNNRFLYVSVTKQMYQFDLSAADVFASIDTIGVYDDSVFGAIFNTMQLAPDGKIYISCGNSVSVYHVINYPDLKGDSCGFQQHSVMLPSLSLGVPNFPNYRLGPLIGSPCDTITGLNELASQKESILKVFPNPATDLVTVDYGFTNWSAPGIVSLVIVNALGQPVYNQPVPEYSGYQRIDVSRYASGVYTAYVKRGGMVLSEQKFAKD